MPVILTLREAEARENQAQPEQLSKITGPATKLKKKKVKAWECIKALGSIPTHKTDRETTPNYHLYTTERLWLRPQALRELS